MTVEVPANKSAVQVLDADQARVLTDQIKSRVDAVWELITQAYTRRAWAALGYESWDVYCIKEFGTARLRIPREERTEIVHSLRQAGLSLRAIESAAGVSRKTVIKDLAPPPPPTTSKRVKRRAVAWEAHTAQVGENPPPTDLDEDAQAEQLIAADVSRPAVFTMPPPPTALIDEPGRAVIIGIDGKSYRRPNPRRDQQKPRRKQLKEAFHWEAWNLHRVVEALTQLSRDDRLRANRDRLASQREHLIRLRDQLDEVIARMEGRGAGD
ncbi:hypothetical protein [Mycobacterium avium]|uniref:hypothetical protein n=1 Tax=Mycobacterium avium TaxID=1764 RepID=UPI0007A0B3DF|nr:hypothetical protein [Mycobacterium avium]